MAAPTPSHATAQPFDAEHLVAMRRAHALRTACCGCSNVRLQVALYINSPLPTVCCPMRTFYYSIPGNALRALAPQRLSNTRPDRLLDHLDGTATHNEPFASLTVLHQHCVYASGLRWLHIARTSAPLRKKTFSSSIQRSTLLLSLPGAIDGVETEEWIVYKL